MSSTSNIERNMETLAEVIDTANDIAGGAQNRRPLDEDQLYISNRPAIGIRPYTESKIKFMSTINHWDRRVFLDFKEAFADAQAEIEADDVGVTGSTGQG